MFKNLICVAVVLFAGVAYAGHCQQNLVQRVVVDPYQNVQRVVVPHQNFVQHVVVEQVVNPYVEYVPVQQIQVQRVQKVQKVQVQRVQQVQKVQRVVEKVVVQRQRATPIRDFLGSLRSRNVQQVRVVERVVEHH